MRMIRILVPDVLMVCIKIYMISLIIKNGPSSANYITFLLRLKEKYRDFNNNNRLSNPTLGNLLRSVLTLTSPRHLLLSHERHCLLLLLLHLLLRWVMCLLCSPNGRRRLILLVLHRAAPPTSCATATRPWDMSLRIARIIMRSLLQMMEGSKC